MPLPRLRVGPASGCLKEGPELWGPPTGGGSLLLKGRSRPEPPEEERETALAPGAPARGTSRGGMQKGYGVIGMVLSGQKAGGLGSAWLYLWDLLFSSWNLQPRAPPAQGHLPPHDS